MIQLHRTLLMALIILMAATVSGQTPKLDDFLDKLKQSHPLFEREKLSAQIAEEEGNPDRGLKIYWIGLK